MKFDVYVTTTTTRNFTIEAESEFEAKQLAEAKEEQLLSGQSELSHFDVENVEAFDENED